MLFDLIERFPGFFIIFAMTTIPFLVGHYLDVWFVDGPGNLQGFWDYCVYWLLHSIIGLIVIVISGMILGMIASMLCLGDP